MSAKSKLYKMAIMGAMLSSMAQTSEREFYEKEQNKEPKKPIIPNGCKEYHFTRSGRFDTTENMWNDIDYIFTCIASNAKNAVKKFEKWSNENNS
jgi:hypothetical protein